MRRFSASIWAGMPRSGAVLACATRCGHMPLASTMTHTPVPRRSLRRTVLLTPLFALALSACGGNETEQEKVEAALDRFAQDLAATPIDPATLPARIQTYLKGNPSFFGSTVALIGANQKVTISPYVYQKDGGYADLNLMDPAYDIDNQTWLVVPRSTGKSNWTAPYFDDGGGNIWMLTRSVPLINSAGQVYAVVTTDLPTANPNSPAR